MPRETTKKLVEKRTDFANNIFIWFEIFLVFNYSNDHFKMLQNFRFVMIFTFWFYLDIYGGLSEKRANDING